jgi:nucleotide sugar dehydrogenase
VGHATGLGLLHLGHDVTFVDINQDRLLALRADGLTVAYVDEWSLSNFDAVFVAMPTPTDGENGTDLSYIDSACKALGRMLQEVHGTRPLLVFRSTMPPGTTQNRIIPALEQASGKRTGSDFLVCYNPEYLRAYNAVGDFLQARYLTIGTAAPGDEASTAIRAIFAAMDAEVSEFSYEQAEYQKYVHNIFNATKISFFNEMREAASKLGVSDTSTIFELTSKTSEACYNPSYGIRDFGPFGGECLPKDTAAWTAFARQRGINSYMVEATRQVNIALGGKPC